MKRMPDTEATATVALSAHSEAPSESPLSSRKRNLMRFSTRVAVAAATLTVVVLVLAVVAIKRNGSSGATTAKRADGDPTEGSAVIAPNVVRIDGWQMESITLETVSTRAFRAEKIATGRIGFNEDVLTPVFSPYTGRVMRLLAKPGDAVREGTPLLEIDTPDLVQVEQDLIAANVSVSKQKTVLGLVTRVEDRQHRLYLNKAVALKDWEQAEADVKNAERDLHSTESVLVSARSRLRVFGKTDQEIAQIESDRQIDRIARVASPIGGTIVARKVGPGQYVKPDSPDPLFTIADLSTVWLTADVYESDVPLIRVGQPIQVRVAAFPNESFNALISHIGASVDPSTRRVAVRSVVENRGRKLKPEMFATFRVVTDSQIQSLAVPVNAIVHDGSKTCAWVSRPVNQFARQEVLVGIEQDGWVQILSGLQAGDRVVSQGSVLFSNLASS